MNGFDALQQLVAEAASTRKMIEQIQASIGYKAMAQQLAEAASTRKMIEQIQASIGYKAVAQQLAEASSISRLLAAGLRGPGLLRSAEFRAATGIVTGDMTADIIEELPATDVDDTLRDITEDEAFAALLDEAQRSVCRSGPGHLGGVRGHRGCG